MIKHGTLELRGMDKVPPGVRGDGQRFGRMLHQLHAYTPPDEFLIEIGRRGSIMDEGASDARVGDSNSIPAGMAFFGQFVDHDVTFDTASSLDRQNDPAALTNFRTPHLDLDSVYGKGPANDPQLYQATDSDKFLIGNSSNPDDLPRNAEGVALIPDPRNDENLIISQMQYLFLRFHNRVVDFLRDNSAGPTGNVFERAQQIVRWHYQWIIINEFLPLICDEDVLSDVLENRLKFFKYNRGRDIYMPVEFAGAAYRFGHSLIRQKYKVNDEIGQELTLFGDPSTSLNKGFEPVPENKVIDWSNFFKTSNNSNPQPSRKIDNKLPSVLFELPFDEFEHEPSERKSLAVRNLLRGKRLGLPSGQRVAKFMGPRVSRGRDRAEVLSSSEIGLRDTISNSGLPDDTDAPLWYYVLSEAQVQNDGEHLGKVGSRIVAETIIGLIQSDNSSYLTASPNWTPGDPGSEQPSPLPRSVSDGFTMGDLADFALSD